MKTFAFGLLLILASASGNILVPRATLDASPYAEWAHTHWVWVSDHNGLNQSNAIKLVDDYLERGIKVGATDIDSAWHSCFNNFQFDSSLFPSPQTMIDYFHSKDIRVILWATSMIDVDCTDIYNFARNNSYFIRDVLDRQMPPLKWWHGHGCLIDYFNKDALGWWHSLLDNVIDMGIDGWKVDGTDPFILELVVPRSQGGRVISYRDYADAFYSDFFFYTQTKLGKDRLIMSRPVDSFGPVFLSFSPKDVMFSGWVGDLDADWSGYKTGLERMRASARRNYLNFGTDIGGYRGCGGGACRELILYLRWFQFSAFTPLMENGGNDFHSPWQFDEKYNPGENSTVENYREYVDEHYKLIPYLLSTGARRFAMQKSAMEFQSHSREDFSYLLGDDVFVVPPLSNATAVEINFPQGSVWQCWWNHSYSFKGGEHKTMDYPPTRLPVFQRGNTIIPTYDTACKDYSAHLVARIAVTDISSLSHSFPVVEEKSGGLILSMSQGEGSSVVLTSSPHEVRSVTFALRLAEGVPQPTKVVDHQQVPYPQRSVSSNECLGEADSVWWGVGENGIVYIHHPSNDVGAIATVHF